MTIVDPRRLGSSRGVVPYHALMIVAAILTGLLSFANPATGQQPDEYSRLLAMAKSDPMTVDFSAMRRAYVSRPDYSGYIRINEHDHAVQAAATRGDFVEAERLLERMLDECYVRIHTHVMATVVYDMKGDQRRKAFHQTTYRQIFRAVTAGRNGRSPATAFEVVNIIEEYDMMEAWQLRRGVQRLMEYGGRTYDVWQVSSRERPAESFDLYFDVTNALAGLDRALKPHIPKR